MSKWTVLLDTEAFRTLHFEADDLLVDNTDGVVSYALVEHFQPDGSKEIGSRVVFASTAVDVKAVWEDQAAASVAVPVPPPSGTPLVPYA